MYDHQITTGTIWTWPRLQITSTGHEFIRRADRYARSWPHSYAIPTWLGGSIWTVSDVTTYWLNMTKFLSIRYWIYLLCVYFIL